MISPPPRDARKHRQAPPYKASPALMPPCSCSLPILGLSQECCVERCAGRRPCSFHVPLHISRRNGRGSSSDVSLPPAQTQDVTSLRLTTWETLRIWVLFGAFILPTDFQFLSKRFFGSRGVGRELILNSCACISLPKYFRGKSKRISSP